METDPTSSAAPAREPRTATRRRRDVPDTAEAFQRIAALPEGADRERIRQEVAAAWLPMAHRLARRYRDRGENLEDLEQVAALGLVKAVERYDPARGHAFESYAIPTIVGEVKRHFRDNGWDLHVPRRVQTLRNRVRTALQEFASRPGHGSPTVAELAAETGLGEEDVQLGLEAMRSYSSLSLEAELSTGNAEDEGCTLLETLGTEEHGFDRVVDREAVRPCLCHLPEREQHILYLRFFCDMTQSRIANLLGISQMHVSRLLSHACRQVREEIESDARPQPADAEEGAGRHGPAAAAA
ncbi:SigB/SigF/SigG family RNA polymerase sigma factor [Streptomyces xiaopingdaonensis]|uniref:SigB/SigF/SigG family RNA polymerase sigma factor n=1 Tax=Streptomyces xiaopingdaonensis TaxID=1565415 RepID=UPI0002D396FA|nr:SigB/SigF/SigG family RNA polymerase sigma factor [Streptomyces xiaopingdaonensis]